MNYKKLQIPGLYRIPGCDYEKIIKIYMDAFRSYPKLMSSFPDEEARIAALEATLRFYVMYDLRYGAAFSLDESICEACIIVHSDNMKYSVPKHLLSGSYGRGYRTAMKKLTRQERKKRIQLFDELDRLEADVKIPTPHIYVDFLGVAGSYQHQGRGRRLMSLICAYADEVKLPVMLFTNTDEDVTFYQSLGFDIIEITSSEKFGFTNTYMLYTPYNL